MGSIGPDKGMTSLASLSIMRYPLDPLSASEIEQATNVVHKTYPDVSFNAVTLHEPRKAEMLAFLEAPETAPRPLRTADIVAIGRGSKVYDGLVDLENAKIISWQATDDVQPLIAMEDLQIVESIARTDEKVIEQCILSGIPREDMHKVYCDP